MSKNFVSYPDALEVLNAYADEINKSVKKYSVMPTYTNFPLGSIIQYVGDDTGDYVNGYFYERAASGWVQKNIQPPTSGLGTAAFLDVAESGDAASTEVVMGNDSRLTNARPASDVPAWAKAANKPAYTKAEVGLANVDNTSDSTKKTNFTGSIASGNTGFTTGGDVYTALDGKVDKVSGKELSTNDYTDEDKEKVDKIDVLSTSVSGNPISFTTKSAQLANNAEIVLEPIQAGSGEPSPTNVRAISGYNEININGYGKNLLPMSIEKMKRLNTGGTWSGNAYTVYGVTFTILTNSQGQVIGIDTNGKATSNIAFYICDDFTYLAFDYILSGCPGGKGNNTRLTGSGIGLDIGSGVTITGKGGYTGSIYIYIVNDQTVSTDIDVFRPMLRPASISDATYEPYNPATDITLKLNETVYGGKLNVRSGELRVDTALVTITGDIQLYGNYGTYNAPLFYYEADVYFAPYSDTSKPDTNKLISNAYALIDVSDFVDMKDYSFRTRDYESTNRIYFRDSRFTTASDYNTWAASNPIQILGKLTTPYTIQLTPHEISLLLGDNVVTTNGTAINLDYNANGEIASLDDLSGVGEAVNALSDIVADNIEIKANKTDIAYVESGTTASRAYPEGELVYVGGVLYKVLTDIASGQSFTIGTNVEATSIDTRLKEIDTQLQLVTGNAPANITSRLGNLSAAVAEQNLEKYGYKIGDYFTGASEYTYHIADLDTFYGGYNSYAIVTSHHIGIVVDTKADSKWNETADISNVNYKDSTLHTFLSTTVLNNIKSDFTALFGSWESHLVAHDKLYGKLGGWAWSSNSARSEYISALTECQVYGCPIWSADNYQQGEGDKQLELFRKKKYNAIFGNIIIWLRSISTASNACDANDYGRAHSYPITNSIRAAGLILFK